MNKENIMNKLKGGLIVSCQALENEPLHSDFIMGRMAVAAKMGGAVAIRANSVKDIAEIKKLVDLPVIGLIKRDYPDSERYITPTMKEIKELIEVGVDIVAMDATLRPQTDNVTLAEKVKYLHDHNILVMADVSNFEEGVIADKAGFDLISTTLSGYTTYTEKLAGPDYKLIKRLVKAVKTPIVGEGRIRNEKELKKVLRQKPFAIVIGSAITRPQEITKYYAEIIK